MESQGLLDKKTEKLVTALYLLTSFFDEKEPMKWHLRDLGNKLLSQNNNPNLVRETMGLLSVGKQAGLISDMNFEVIHREFSRLLSAPLTLPEMFVVEERLEPAPVAETAPEIKDKTYLSVEAPAEIAKKPLKEFGAVAVKKNSRQSVIISLLKRKKEIMIKDVSPLIDGVSEKTIQRELLSMVSAGILRKEGEKRWSRYSLAE